jgi:hypothetical protein
MKTSSLRKPGFSASKEAMRANSACFVAVARVSLTVI